MNLVTNQAACQQNHKLLSERAREKEKSRDIVDLTLLRRTELFKLPTTNLKLLFSYSKAEHFW